MPNSRGQAATVAGMLVNRAVGECQRAQRLNRTAVDQIAINNEVLCDLQCSGTGNFKMSSTAGIRDIVKGQLLGVAFGKDKFCISGRRIGILCRGIRH
ncbi:MAG: hypothetical protein ALAOOOJD_02679 [bacterium]|nr:hypothetical protein [bacterium]